MDLQGLKTVFRQWAMVLSTSILLVACKQEEKLPYYHTADFTPLWLSKPTDTLHRIADFKVLDQSGEIMTNQTFDGKVYVANFFFTSCPGICARMTRNLKILTDTFSGNDKVKFISYSVTPDIDTVPRLKEYAEQFKINNNQWHLVTGDKNSIYTLARQSYFAEEEIGYNKDSTEFLHTEHLLLVDKDRHLRGVYNGTVKLEVYRLKEDIDKLLKELEE